MASDVMTEAYGYAAASDMLDAPDPPTAFVVSSIIPAIGVRRAAVSGACASAGTSRSSAMTTC
jgi:DNA-binding LacI/PurR family transcriptional regulator